MKTRHQEWPRYPMHMKSANAGHASPWQSSWSWPSEEDTVFTMLSECNAQKASPRNFAADQYGSI